MVLQLLEKMLLQLIRLPRPLLLLLLHRRHTRAIRPVC